MNYTIFHKVIADIEKNLEGGGYTVHIRTKSGHTLRDFSWSPLAGSSSYTDEYEIIILSQGDRPPVYMTIYQIESIELAS
jgi:hypothetical protein